MSRASKRLAAQTLARPSKKASDVKTADKFPLAQIQALAARPKNSRAPVGLWTLANIFAARDCQMRGDFERAARVAEAMRTFPPLLVARKNRLEAQKGIAVAVEPAADTGRGRAIAAEGAPLFGEDGLAISSATAADIEGCLVDHGLAVGYNTWIPREDGTRTDVLHVMWPIEFIRRDPLTGGLLARLHDWSEVPVTHGDGRWVVYSKHEDHPERQDGAVLAACLVWATGAYAWRDWSKGSVAHGNAKVIGELPAGVALQTESGGMTDEASAMVELLRSVAYDDTPIGLKPAGSKLDYMVNSSTAWQVWEKLGQMAEKAAARIYLGTDGTLGSQGGAPGVDVDALFGVARTYIEGDLRCIERCFYAGVIVPWTAINFGDSSMAPHRVYQIPDVDQDTATDAMAKRRQAFYADLEKQRANGFPVTQETVDKLAAEYRVTAPLLAAPVEVEPVEGEPIEVAPAVVAAPTPDDVARAESAFQKAIKEAKDNGFVIDQPWVDEAAKRYGVVVPKLPPSAEKAPTIALAPTDVVEWISPNEVRAASGLGPMLQADGTPDPAGKVQIRIIRKNDKAAEEAAKAAAEIAQTEAEKEPAVEPATPDAPAPDLATQADVTQVAATARTAHARIDGLGETMLTKAEGDALRSEVTSLRVALAHRDTNVVDESVRRVLAELARTPGDQQGE